LGAVLLPLLGIKSLIYGTAIVSLICAIARAFAIREVERPPSPRELVAIRRIFDAGIRRFLFAACFFAAIYPLTLWGPFPSLHAEDAFHLTKPQINSLFALGGFACILASLLGGRMTDRYGGRNTLMAACLGHVLTTLLWALKGTSPLGWVLFVASNVGLQVSIIAYNSLLAQVAPPHSRARFIGLFGTITGLVSTIVPTLGALLRESFGSEAPFWGAIVLGLATSLSLRKVNETYTIYSIGHSTRSFEELVELLKAFGIQALADVRRFPTSKKNPHFDREFLEEQLPSRGIEYFWLGDLLGGYRDGGYERYTETEGFRRGLFELEELAREKPTCFMCAEKLYFRCHRRFIADELVKRGWCVLHIIEPGRKPYEHKREW
jgi:hypothetical protein